MEDATPLTAPDAATGLYDVKRLAALLNVRPATIRSMKARKTIPEPTSNDINGGAVWSQEIIESFLNANRPHLELETGINTQLPNVVDLFSGCGGLSLGFRLAGFRVLAGFDNWECAVNTYNANLNHPAHLLDLSNLETTIDTLKPFFTWQKPAIIGGPPCQDFSSAGKRAEGVRADLTEKFAATVAHFKPPFFVMENVARAEKAAAFQSALATLKAAGYHTEYLVLNASYCGVPQRRKRLFTFGSPDEDFARTLTTMLETHLNPVETTVKDWFGNRLGTKYYYRHPRSYARRAVFSIDEPSPTIRGVNRPIPNGYPGHPGDAGPIEQARPLTTTERAELQTFPKGFKFEASKTDAEQMIGNAVPVKLAKYVAANLAATLTDSASTGLSAAS